MEAETETGLESELWLRSNGENKDDRMEDLGLDEDSIGLGRVDLYKGLDAEEQNLNTRSRELVLLAALSVWACFV